MTKPDDTIDLGAIQRELEAANQEYNDARAEYRAAQSRLLDAKDRLDATASAYRHCLEAKNG